MENLAKPEVVVTDYIGEYGEIERGFVKVPGNPILIRFEQTEGLKKLNLMRCLAHNRMFSAKKLAGCGICVNGRPAKRVNYVSTWETLPDSRAFAAKGEKNDCAVRAMATALRLSYTEAHGELEKRGRISGKGTYVHQYAPMLLERGWMNVPFKKRVTLRTWLRENGSGRFVVRIARHVFAVENGVIHDTFANNLDSRVRQVWAEG